MERNAQFREGLIAAIPGLRMFGMSLSGRRDRADDLVQETLLKAWKCSDKFEPGTNLKAWLYTILRNEFYNQVRKRSREVEDGDASYASQVAVNGAQQGHVDLADLGQALARLPQQQREAVLLVGASGFSYEEAAEICKVAVGTIKSRVNRARSSLIEHMGVASSAELGPDLRAPTVFGGAGWMEAAPRQAGDQLD